MKKIDQESLKGDEQPLLSQNISIVEVGAHSQTFEKFIDFVGVKSLVITDIDSYKEIADEKDGDKKRREKCCPSDPDATKTSNASLNFFFGTKELKFYKELEFENKSLNKLQGNENWQQDPDGLLKIVYQVEDAGYHARSYEDAFFSINKALLRGDNKLFPSLTKKYFDSYLAGDIDVFEFAEKAVNSKPSLAIEILLNSEINEEGVEFSNWQIPLYIKEGLLWLRQS